MTKFAVTLTFLEKRGKITITNVTAMSQGETEVPLHDGLVVSAQGSRGMRIVTFKRKRPFRFEGVKSLEVNEQKTPQMAEGPL